MAPAVVWLLFLQLALWPTLVVDIKMSTAIKDFRMLHIDYPRVHYPLGFQGYCNGIMAYVRGRKQSWYCPQIHYLVHAPWKEVQKFCKNSESFCENYNEYCTLTENPYPITTCSLDSNQPPTSCHYQTTLSNQRLYLLCSRKRDAEPIDIIGLG
ncbi:probable inactive ribonuclease-like protein 13 [Suricata suricatta]|uniref:probable inactive ribonuclease-like protein 13 n=1 Tax=Suricata suricatta TaxID=37032 RepID=UPI001155EE46|nr:probable inactive ribonuclease-like protein 13 [Suricata suricatta]